MIWEPPGTGGARRPRGTEGAADAAEGGDGAGRGTRTAGPARLRSGDSVHLLQQALARVHHGAPAVVGGGLHVLVVGVGVGLRGTTPTLWASGGEDAAGQARVGEPLRERAGRVRGGSGRRASRRKERRPRSANHGVVPDHLVRVEGLRRGPRGRR